MRTSDLCDQHGDAVLVCNAPFISYGGCRAATARIACVRTFEDASLIRKTLEMPGEGRLLVIDARGSLRAAVFGDRMASIGIANGWRGVIISGAVRDVEALSALDLVVLALGRVPRRGGGIGVGESNVELDIGGIAFAPGDTVALDDDGLIILRDAPHQGQP
ncbi:MULTISPECIES: ribonuclease E activity regulator RraA [unclassified Variovorax]|uniref:ribonuclease E activity regulator RraA n=1 Tax=unclassified Variovorax TaxID=663243 RepID=UPI0008BF8C47|nr:MULTISPECIES: ribonuclease E activity regulator RraA [unclassified Variovorax]SEK17420.1 regulator of ribonuclease activity A [Variovorax sp. OK202]SFE83732.1 regulator of ribonuclease activity A [Variovorax sp. OK212]